MSKNEKINLIKKGFLPLPPEKEKSQFWNSGLYDWYERKEDYESWNNWHDTHQYITYHLYYSNFYKDIHISILVLSSILFNSIFTTPPPGSKPTYPLHIQDITTYAAGVANTMSGLERSQSTDSFFGLARSPVAITVPRSRAQSQIVLRSTVFQHTSPITRLQALPEGSISIIGASNYDSVAEGRQSELSQFIDQLQAGTYDSVEVFRNVFNFIHIEETQAQPILNELNAYLAEVRAAKRLYRQLDQADIEVEKAQKSYDKLIAEINKNVENNRVHKNTIKKLETRQKLESQLQLKKERREAKLSDFLLSIQNNARRQNKIVIDMRTKVNQAVDNMESREDFLVNLRNRAYALTLQASQEESRRRASVSCFNLLSGCLTPKLEPELQSCNLLLQLLDERAEVGFSEETIIQTVKKDLERRKPGGSHEKRVRYLANKNQEATRQAIKIINGFMDWVKLPQGDRSSSANYLQSPELAFEMLKYNRVAQGIDFGALVQILISTSNEFRLRPFEEDPNLYIKAKFEPYTIPLQISQTYNTQHEDWPYIRNFYESDINYYIHHILQISRGSTNLISNTYLAIDIEHSLLHFSDNAKRVFQYCKPPLGQINTAPTTSYSTLFLRRGGPINSPPNQ